MVNKITLPFFLISSDPDGCIKWPFKLLSQVVNSEKKPSKNPLSPLFPKLPILLLF